MVLLLIIDKIDYPRFVRGRILTTVSLARSEPEFRTLVPGPSMPNRARWAYQYSVSAMFGRHWAPIRNWFKVYLGVVADTLSGY
jgi:hypothetical protein